MGTSLASYLRLYRAHGLKRVWMHWKEVECFDWRRGVDTATWLPLSDYAMDTSGMKHYQASLTSELVRDFTLAARLADAPRYAFYDLGCGKGKALILAAEHLRPGRLAGVELHPALAHTARANLRKLGIAGEIIEGRVQDFTDYAPRAIVYLCDPFDEATLAQVIGNLQAKAQDALLIYNNPVYDVTRYGFTLAERTDGWHANYRTHLYRWRKN